MLIFMGGNEVFGNFPCLKVLIKRVLSPNK